MTPIKRLFKRVKESLMPQDLFIWPSRRIAKEIASCWSRRFILLFILYYVCSVSVNYAGLPNNNADVREHLERPCVQLEKLQHYEYEAYLLVLILVGPGSVQSRETIRQTWAFKPPAEAIIKFVVGAKNLSVQFQETLKEEEEKFNDIVYLHNFTDSYQHLTMKLLQTLIWASNNVKFQYLLKADDDSFVRVDKVLLELKRKPPERFYWGFFDGRAHVKRSGKYMEKSYVLCDRYLPYALGGGYVISTDLVQFVAKNADYLKLYNNEDVSLGTWLAPLDIIRSHDTRFDTEYKSRGCFNSYLVTHKKGASDMKQMYLNLENYDKLCVREKRERYSYEYNWTVPPSKCCERKDGYV